MSRCLSSALSALAWFAAAGTAWGQAAHPHPAAEPGHPTPPGAAAAASSSASRPHAYRSPFEGYRPFRDQPLVSWREANDLVARLGGWQAYAREGQGGPVAGAAGGPPAPVSPAASTPGLSPAPVKTERPSLPASGARPGHRP